ncbi:MAG: bifunctional DNA primase/polymerase [Candidatus Bathyarchaeia archaeon]
MADLRAAAKQYWLEGCNIVLLRGKEPLNKWLKWQSERQNELEFEALPWNEADGFAIICGQQLHNELYIAAIDFDVKNLPEEIVAKGRVALKHLPITQMERTPSGGEHRIYLSRTKPKTVSAYHNICGLELLGEGKLCIMAPSTGYVRLNDNTPTIVQDLEAIFYEALEKAGVKVEKPAKLWFDSQELAKQPYRGKDPPCIQALLKGTQEGLRNEYGIRLASYFLNFKQYSPKTVREDILKSWNKLNNPELPPKELDAMVKSAVQGRYVYGCTDPILRSQCNGEKCPIAPKNAVKLLTPEERENAEKLLADPKMLDYVVKFGRRRLIGEDNVLQTNFVIICSGQTKYPVSGILSGFSGSGKNESIRAVKPLIPSEWLFEFTTSTPEAVKYIPEEFTGTLVIYEISGLESKTGTLGLRSVGEGESIETIYPMRDEETGKMILGRAKTNARNFLTTESDIGVHPDLYRRVLKLSLNHSDALTRRVIAKKLRDAMLPESLRKKLKMCDDLPYSEKDFQNALRLLDWKVEVILFPPTSLLELERLAHKKEQKVALRSQIERILNFIRVLAILHQKQRLLIEDLEDGSKYVVADVEDFERAIRILAPTILETVSRVERRQAEALETIENSPEEYWDKNKLAEKLGVSTITAARILKTLANLGYLREIQTTRPYSYQPIHDREKAKNLVLLDKISEYKAFYQKELENFLKHILSPHHKLVVRGVSTEKPETSPLQENKQKTTIHKVEQQKSTQFIIEIQETIPKTETGLSLANFGNTPHTHPWETR